MNANRTFGLANVVDIDAQGFLTAKATVIDQPEQGTIAWVCYFSQHGLEQLGIERTSRVFPLRFSFDPIEERIYQPSLSAEPLGKTSERSQATIIKR